MNTSYPENTADRDQEFIYKLSLAVFSTDEIQSFLKENDLRVFNRNNLTFVKSNVLRKVALIFL